MSKRSATCLGVAMLGVLALGPAKPAVRYSFAAALEPAAGADSARGETYALTPVEKTPAQGFASREAAAAPGFGALEAPGDGHSAEGFK